MPWLLPETERESERRWEDSDPREKFGKQFSEL